MYEKWAYMYMLICIFNILYLKIILTIDRKASNGNSGIVPSSLRRSTAGATETSSATTTLSSQRQYPHIGAVVRPSCKRNATKAAAAPVKQDNSDDLHDFQERHFFPLMKAVKLAYQLGLFDDDCDGGNSGHYPFGDYEHHGKHERNGHKGPHHRRRHHDRSDSSSSEESRGNTKITLA